jgi:hypothetical protein
VHISHWIVEGRSSRHCTGIRLHAGICFSDKSAERVEDIQFYYLSLKLAPYKDEWNYLRTELCTLLLRHTPQRIHDQRHTKQLQRALRTFPMQWPPLWSDSTQAAEHSISSHGPRYNLTSVQLPGPAATSLLPGMSPSSFPLIKGSPSV